MGILAKYLDLLPSDARDRVLHAAKWGTRVHVDEDGARNLLGHAEDWSWTPGSIPSCGAPNVFLLRAAAGDELWTDEPLIGRRFARLVQRWGMQWAIALVRQRLKTHSSPRNEGPRRGRSMLVV